MGKCLYKQSLVEKRALIVIYLKEAGVLYETHKQVV